MDTILTNPVLARHMSVKKFLDPRNYSDEIESRYINLALLVFAKVEVTIIMTVVHCSVNSISKVMSWMFLTFFT